MANSIDRIAYNIKLSSKAGREEILKLRKDAIEATREIYDDGSPEGAARVELGKQSAALQETLLNKLHFYIILVKLVLSLWQD